MGLAMARQGWLEKADVLNTYAAQDLLTVLHNKNSSAASAIILLPLPLNLPYSSPLVLENGPDYAALLFANLWLSRLILFLFNDAKSAAAF